MSESTTAGDHRYIKGSEGGVDYLIVAQNGKIVLGMKPLILQAGPAGTVLACRVRSAHASGSLETGGVVQGTSNHVAKAWPDIPFEKISEEVRASIVVGTLINVPVAHAALLSDSVDKVGAGREVCKWVMRRVPETYAVVAPDDMLSWIVEGWQAEIENLGSAPAQPALVTAVDPVSEIAEVAKQKTVEAAEKINQKKKDKKAGYTVIETTGDGKGDSTVAAVKKALGFKSGGGADKGGSLLEAIFSKVVGLTDSDKKAHLANLLKAENLSVDPDQLWPEYQKWAAASGGTGPAGQAAGGQDDQGDDNVVHLWGSKYKAWAQKKSVQSAQETSPVDFEGSDGGALPEDGDDDPGASDGYDEGIQESTLDELWDSAEDEYGETSRWYAMQKLHETYPDSTPDEIDGMLSDCAEAVQKYGEGAFSATAYTDLSEADRAAMVEAIDTMDTNDGNEDAWQYVAQLVPHVDSMMNDASL